MVRDGWIDCPITDVLIPNGIKIGPFGSQLKKETLMPYGQYKVYGQENIYAKDFSLGERYLQKEHFDRLSSCEIIPGDFVMSTMGTIGKCAIVPEGIQKGIMDSHLVRLRFDKKKINQAYLLQLFSDEFGFLKKQTARLSVGGIMDGLSAGIVGSLRISFPESQEEQQAIVSVLTEMDGLIQNLKKEIEKKKNIKYGAMNLYLTGTERLDGFSSEWENIALGEIADVKDGTHQTPKYVDSGFPFYSVETVTTGDFRHVKKISEEEHHRLTASYKIETGDVLMTRIGSLGKCKFIDWDVNASFYVSLALLKFHGNTDLARFVTFVSELRSFAKEVELHALQFAIPMKINLGEIEKIRVTIPSDPNEMVALNRIFIEMEKNIASLEDELEKLMQVKQGMMSNLLTGKIRLI
ncbi:MAG: restriction endonuclease subunit S [Eubacteriales bacterium]|nr:restriction endonuclease subunit S [Eubacteriales bacterium]